MSTVVQPVKPHSVRVVCEYAGSGEFLKAFNFDFVSLPYSALARLIVSNSDHQHTSKLHNLISLNLRLFLGHNGPELSVNHGLFGRHLTRTREEAEATWKLAQQAQTLILDKHGDIDSHNEQVQDSYNYDVVLSISTYDAQDTMAYILHTTQWHKLTWWLKFNETRVNTLEGLRYNVCYFNRYYIKLGANADGIVLTIRENASDALKTVVVLKMTINAFLQSANIMATQAQFLDDFSSVSQELRNNQDFMALVPRHVGLASPAVRDSKDFALEVYYDDKRKLQGFYKHLSSRLKEDPDIVLLAFRSEGYRVLRQAPLHVRDNEELVMACVSYNFRAIAYVSDRLAVNQKFMRLCMLEADKQHFDKRTQQNIVAQRIKTVTHAIVS